MKKIFFVLLAAIVAFSCSKSFLDEESRGNLLVEGFFDSKTELDMACAALNKALMTTCANDYWLAMFQGADDLTVRANQSKENMRDFDMFFSTKDNNLRLNETWKSFYGLVSCSNFIINGASGSVNASQADINNALGQAYFMRGYAYYFLTRIWGHVPLVTTNQADYNIKKSTPQEIYALIIEDLKNAEELLPEKWTTAPNAGRTATKGAAKSVLASVYLTMTGYPVKDATKYALAAAKSKEVLDAATTYGYSLVPNIGDLWLDVPTNSELVFGAFFNVAITGEQTYIGPKASQCREELGSDDYFCELYFFNNFPPGPRKDATFQTYMVSSAVNAAGTHDTIQYQNSQTKHPYFQKYRLANGYTWATYIPYKNVYPSSRTAQIIRFAEVKLIYAEAQAMAAGTDASAYQQINDVRLRAGLPELTPGLSQIDFRDAVVAERGWEFAGDEWCHRWHDLVRLERVEEANSHRDALENPLQNTPSKAFYWAPIPIEERRLNPNLN